MNKDYILNLNLGNLNIKVSNMKVTCYGSMDLMDFDYHLTLEFFYLSNQTIIKQEMKGDIIDLSSFCNSQDCLNSPANDCCLYILKSNEGYKIILKMPDSEFYTNTVCTKDKLDDFKNELNAIFATLIEEYRNKNSSPS